MTVTLLIVRDNFRAVEHLGDLVRAWLESHHREPGYVHQTHPSLPRDLRESGMRLGVGRHQCFLIRWAFLFHMLVILRCVNVRSSVRVIASNATKIE